MTLTPAITPQLDGSMEGFVIKEIEIYKFMRYRQKSTISFHNQFTVIAGQTGHGKTTILDAVTFALYRRTSRIDLKGVNLEDICDNSGYVRVIFDHKGSTYLVKRGRDRAGKSTLILERNGHKIDGTIRELDERIEEIIGLDYLGFRNSTFIRQDEMRALGAEIGSKRLEIFQKLFRLELFEKAQQLADQQFRKTQSDVSKAEVEVQLIQNRLQNFPNTLNEKSNLEKQIKELKKQLDSTISKVAAVEIQQAELQKKHDEFVRLDGLEKELEENIKLIKERLREAAKLQAKAKELQLDIHKLEENTNDYEMILQQINALRVKVAEQIQKKKAIEEQKEQLEQNLTNTNKKHEARKNQLNIRLGTQENRIVDLEKTTLDKDEAFDVLRTEGMLNERISRIEKELQWLSDNLNITQELRKEQLQAKSHLDGVQIKTGQINKDSFVLSEIRQQITQIKEDQEKNMAEYLQETNQIQKQLDTNAEARKKLDIHDEDVSKLRHLEQLEKEKQIQRELLKQKLSELKIYETLPGRVASLDQDLQEKQHALEKIRGDKISFTKFENEFIQIQEIYSSLRDQQENVRSEIAEKTGIIKKLTNDIQDFEKLSEQVKEKEIALKGFQDALEVYTILRENIFHKTGVPMHAIQQILPLISREASMNLSDITDKRLTQLRLSPYSEGGGYGIKIEVAGTNNRWMDVQEFSGGEKTQINGALRLAIAKELARMPQIGRTYGQMRTLFIDEGDLGSLDTEISRRLFIQKLFEQGEFFQKIILITHLTDIIDMFPGKIRIYMTPTGESRVELGEAQNNE